MGNSFGDKVNRLAGKALDAHFNAMQRLGFFSRESVDKQIAAEERDRQWGEAHPELWCAKHLGKHAVKAVLRPIGGDVLGEVAGDFIHKIRK